MVNNKSTAVPKWRYTKCLLNAYTQIFVIGQKLFAQLSVSCIPKVFRRVQPYHLEDRVGHPHDAMIIVVLMAEYIGVICIVAVWQGGSQLYERIGLSCLGWAANKRVAVIGVGGWQWFALAQ